MKRILVVQYSQTGQLSSAMAHCLAPLLADPDISVYVETLKPVTPYPFPWPFFRFLDVFPETVYQDAPALQSLSLRGDEDFDLVILAYQVWFLSPALPMAAFMQSPEAARLLRGKPVVTLIACRNMWLMAQERMKQYLDGLGARLVDNIALTDQSGALASFITTPRWMFTGRREAFWGLPAAGVSETDLRGSARFGAAMAEALHAGPIAGPMLHGLGAAVVDERLIASERIGTRSFRLWGKLLRAAGPQGSARRRPLLAIYVCFLFCLIVTVVPLSMALRALLHPLVKRRLLVQKAYFEQPSGSATHHLSPNPQ
ncbi:MAG: dialkylresorcinol condensing enzyme [Gammaproteobacteria bacterium]|nr:dialkylresorcinol condensing enzyme [Gammaproteobacteria bacterium]